MKISEETFDPDRPQITLTSANEPLSTFQLITIMTEGLVDSDKYRGLVGQIPTELYRTSDSTLALIVPEVPIGFHQLISEFSSDNLLLNVAKITSLSSNPDEIIDLAIERLNSEIDDLGFLITDSVEVYGQINDLVEVLVNLDDADKVLAAKIYLANQQSVENLVQAIADFQESTGRIGQENVCGEFDTDFDFVACLERNNESFSQNILSNSLKQFGNSLRAFGSKGFKYYLGTTLTYLRHYTVLVDYMEALYDSFEKKIVPEFLDIVMDQSDGRLDNLVLEENEELLFQVAVRKRPISRDDINSDNNVLRSVANSLFDIELDMSEMGISSDLFHTSQYSASTPELQYLSVEIFDNENVRGHISKTEDKTTFAISFDTDEPTDQQFFYRLVYDNGVSRVHTMGYGAELDIQKPSLEILNLDTGFIHQVSAGQPVEIEFLLRDELGNPLSGEDIRAQIIDRNDPNNKRSVFNTRFTGSKCDDNSVSGVTCWVDSLSQMTTDEDGTGHLTWIPVGQLTSGNLEDKVFLRIYVPYKRDLLPSPEAQVAFDIKFPQLQVLGGLDQNFMCEEESDPIDFQLVDNLGSPFVGVPVEAYTLHYKDSTEHDIWGWYFSTGSEEIVLDDNGFFNYSFPVDSEEIVRDSVSNEIISCKCWEDYKLVIRIPNLNYSTGGFQFDIDCVGN